MSKGPADFEWRSEIAARFREAIKERHLTNAQAAEMLGVKRQTMWLYLNEKATPGGNVIGKACQLWGISMSRKGVEFSAGAFRPKRKTSAPRPRHMGLFDALKMLREAELETQVIGKSGEYFDLRIRIRSSRAILSRKSILDFE
jgi:transcriptional regulator with XRE-family HTH domain